MIRMLINGEWDPKEFLVVEPGQRIVARYDEGIIRAERGEGLTDDREGEGARHDAR